MKGKVKDKENLKLRSLVQVGPGLKHYHAAPPNSFPNACVL